MSVSSTDSGADPAPSLLAGPPDTYAPPGERPPLRSYAVLAAAFTALLGGFVGHRARRGKLPPRVALTDVVLAGVATQQAARLLARDRVTAFVRAPFTRFQGRAGRGEVEEKPRGRGLQRAVGELILCPYCLAMWFAAAFTAAFIAVPRVARTVAAVLAVRGVAETLQLARGALQRRAEGH